MMRFFCYPQLRRSLFSFYARQRTWLYRMRMRIGL